MVKLHIRKKRFNSLILQDVLDYIGSHAGVCQIEVGVERFAYEKRCDIILVVFWMARGILCDWSLCRCFV